MEEQISIRKQLVGTESNMESPDAFTMMVQANEEGETKYALDNDELVCLSTTCRGSLYLMFPFQIGNVFVLLFAGHGKLFELLVWEAGRFVNTFTETTAHTFAAALSYLAVNPDIQQEILDHIVSVVGWDGKPVRGKICHMPSSSTTLTEILDFRRL